MIKIHFCQYVIILNIGQTVKCFSIKEQETKDKGLGTRDQGLGPK